LNKENEYVFKLIEGMRRRLLMILEVLGLELRQFAKGRILSSRICFMLVSCLAYTLAIEILLLARVRVLVTNNNGFWIE
jgi:hypothetical protein